MTRVLSIVATAYRGTLEEQDDTILWLSSMCKSAGLDVAVLLEGSAVNYAVRGHDARGLRFGDVELRNPPTLDHDITALVAAGVPVHYVRDDAATLGIDRAALVEGVEPVERAELPSMFGGFDLVWRW
jgi:hypothetical protein